MGAVGECAGEGWDSVVDPAAASEEALALPSGEGLAEVEDPAEGLEEGPVAASGAVEVAGEPAAGAAIAPK